MRSTPAPASASPGCTTCRTSVQSALAPDRTSRAARPHGAGGFVLFLSLLVVLVGLSGCDHEVDIKPPAAKHDSTGQHAGEAQQTLDTLVAALKDGSHDRAVGTATHDSRQLLGWVADNAAALKMGQLSMRYVD